MQKKAEVPSGVRAELLGHPGGEVFGTHGFESRRLPFFSVELQKAHPFVFMRRPVIIERACSADVEHVG
jgi:hypothetical protein